MSVTLSVTELVREARNIETFSKTKLFARVSVFYPDELIKAVQTAKLDEVRICCIRFAIKNGWYELLTIKDLRSVALRRGIKIYNLSKSIIISKLEEHDNSRKLEEEG